MSPRDHDLLAMFAALPDHTRSDFLDFFGMSRLTTAQIDDIGDALSASLELKLVRGRADTH